MLLQWNGKKAVYSIASPLTTTNSSRVALKTVRLDASTGRQQRSSLYASQIDDIRRERLLLEQLKHWKAIPRFYASTAMKVSDGGGGGGGGGGSGGSRVVNGTTTSPPCAASLVELVPFSLREVAARLRRSPIEGYCHTLHIVDEFMKLLEQMARAQSVAYVLCDWRLEQFHLTHTYDLRIIDVDSLFPTSLPPPNRNETSLQLRQQRASKPPPPPPPIRRPCVPEKWADLSRHANSACMGARKCFRNLFRMHAHAPAEFFCNATSLRCSGFDQRANIFGAGVLLAQLLPPVQSEAARLLDAANENEAPGARDLRRLITSMHTFDPGVRINIDESRLRLSQIRKRAAAKLVCEGDDVAASLPLSSSSSSSAPPPPLPRPLINIALGSSRLHWPNLMRIIVSTLTFAHSSTLARLRFYLLVLNDDRHEMRELKRLLRTSLPANFLRSKVSLVTFSIDDDDYDGDTDGNHDDQEAGERVNLNDEDESNASNARGGDDEVVDELTAVALRHRRQVAYNVARFRLPWLLPWLLEDKVLWLGPSVVVQGDVGDLYDWHLGTRLHALASIDSLLWSTFSVAERARVLLSNITLDIHCGVGGGGGEAGIGGGGGVGVMDFGVAAGGGAGDSDGGGGHSDGAIRDSISHVPCTSFNADFMLFRLKEWKNRVFGQDTERWATLLSSVQRRREPYQSVLGNSIRLALMDRFESLDGSLYDFVRISGSSKQRFVANEEKEDGGSASLYDGDGDSSVRHQLPRVRLQNTAKFIILSSTLLYQSLDHHQHHHPVAEFIGRYVATLNNADEQRLARLRSMQLTLFAAIDRIQAQRSPSAEQAEDIGVFTHTSVDRLKDERNRRNHTQLIHESFDAIQLRRQRQALRMRNRRRIMLLEEARAQYGTLIASSSASASASSSSSSSFSSTSPPSLPRSSAHLEAIVESNKNLIKSHKHRHHLHRAIVSLEWLASSDDDTTYPCPVHAEQLHRCAPTLLIVGDYYCGARDVLQHLFRDYGNRLKTRSEAIDANAAYDRVGAAAAQEISGWGVSSTAYFSRLPLILVNATTTSSSNSLQLLVDRVPSALESRLLPVAVRKELPQTKIVLVLCDPVRRTLNRFATVTGGESSNLAHDAWEAFVRSSLARFKQLWSQCEGGEVDARHSPLSSLHRCILAHPMPLSHDERRQYAQDALVQGVYVHRVVEWASVYGLEKEFRLVYAAADMDATERASFAWSGQGEILLRTHVSAILRDFFLPYISALYDYVCDELEHSTSSCLAVQHLQNEALSLTFNH